MKKVCNRYISLVKSKLCTFLIVTLTIVCLFYFLRKKTNPTVTNGREQETYLVHDFLNTEYYSKNLAFDGDKIIHLDLKGAPPKISYYKKLFPLLSKLGATGILIEYEDMFPYAGILKNISALNAYGRGDVKMINKLAKDNNLKVIPLVQTFGHMEFILKLPEFKEYREVAAYPQVICPTHENTLKIIEDIIRQMVSAHPEAELIHIGADEVYYLGVCDRCTDTMSKYNLSKNLLFLEHISNIVEFIRKTYPHLKVLMWDDQFRSITAKDLKVEHLNSIQPVVWKYSKEVYEELGPSLWNVYSKIFPKIWVATAFKGATGSNQFVSDVTHYLQNHRSWLSVITEYKNIINFQGIILTGWQRYDHFAVLCELLPVGIPTLAMSLRLLLGYNDSPLSPPTEVAKILHCEQPYALIGSVFGSPKCSYPGGKILEFVLHLQQLKQEFETISEDSRVYGWMSDYNIAHSFSNPNHVETVTSSLGRIRSELSQIDREITSAMFEVYDNYTIDEWKETYIKPFEKKINEMWEAKEVILAKDTWPRRPLLNEL